MKYTVFAAIVIGLAIACYAGVQYTRELRPEEAESRSTASLVIPLAFGGLIVLGGIMIWVFMGKAELGLKGSGGPRRTRKSGALPAADSKGDSPDGWVSSRRC